MRKARTRLIMPDTAISSLVALPKPRTNERSILKFYSAGKPIAHRNALGDLQAQSLYNQVRLLKLFR
jgi:hypothetical protein